MRWDTWYVARKLNNSENFWAMKDTLRLDFSLGVFQNQNVDYSWKRKAPYEIMLYALVQKIPWEHVKFHATATWVLIEISSH